MLTATLVVAVAVSPFPESQAAEPGRCVPTRVAGERFVGFERFAVGETLDGRTLPPGIQFVPEDALTDLMVVEPTWEDLPDRFTPPPVSHALLNSPGDREYGSMDLPLRIRFSTAADFVAVTAGLQHLAEPFTATLTAYGLNEARELVAVRTDSETLGLDGVTPVCLAVEAAGQILEITINYNRVGGVVEPELIDNLIVRFPATPVPTPGDETPPTVTIDHPVEGSTVAAPFVRLDGTVTEERELAGGELWINGEPWDALGFTPLGEHTYGFFVDALPAFQLITCGANELEVRVWDAAGNEASDSVGFLLDWEDLAVVRAEPVQVLYGAPLVTGKATAFRITVSSTFCGEVAAEFRLGLPADQWDTGAPGEAGDANPDWRLPDRSGPVTIPANATGFEVMLPYIPEGAADAAWDPVASPFGKAGPRRAAPRPSADRVVFSVEVDPANALAEADERNNTYESDRLETVTTRPVHIVFAGQAWDHAQLVTASRFTSEGQFLDRLRDYAAEQMDYLLGTYPVADAKVTWEVLDAVYYRGGLVSYFQDHGCWVPDPDTGVVGEMGCNPCFLSRMASMVQADETTSHAHAVALVQPFGCCGCDSGSIAFYVEDDGVRDGTLVHELGHQDGRSADCYCCMPADGICPCSDGCSTVACDSCHADEGFWVNQWQPYDESAWYFMWFVADPGVIWSRLHPCRTTEGTETRAGYLELIELLADEADPAAVVVRGTLSADDAASFAPFLRVDQAVVDLQPGSTGTHAVVFVDDAGRVLAGHGFTPVFTRYLPEPTGGVEADTFHFSYRIAWMEGIAAIELRDADGQVLASRAVSAQPPAVRLLSPNGGEQWTPGSREEVRWEGSDPDGGSLSYALWISDDGGENWQPLAIDIAETAYTVDTTGFPVGDAFRLKVRATDGVNTATAVSAGSFALLESEAGPEATTVPATTAAPQAEAGGTSWVWMVAGAAVAGLAGIGLLTYALLRRRRAAAPPPPPPAA